MNSHKEYLNLIRSKLKTTDEILHIKSELHSTGKRMAFTNGCFDILHRGHVEYLAKTAEMADYMVIGLNSDASVKRQNKSPERPINDEHTRCFNLSALFFVDAVVLFEEDSPYEIIKTIIPDILIKGSDYDASETNPNSRKYIVGSDVVRKAGGIVSTIPLVEGYSTTRLIEKIKRH